MSNKLLLIALLFVSSSFSLTGCETVKGAGQDIENAGEAMEDAVE